MDLTGRVILATETCERFSFYKAHWNPLKSWLAYVRLVYAASVQPCNELKMRYNHYKLSSSVLNSVPLALVSSRITRDFLSVPQHPNCTDLITERWHSKGFQSRMWWEVEIGRYAWVTLGCQIRPHEFGYGYLLMTECRSQWIILTEKLPSSVPSYLIDSLLFYLGWE